MRKSTDANQRHPRPVVFGIDKAPAERPWRETRLNCVPTETMVYLVETGLPIRAEIHNVSRSGLRLVLDRPVAVGAAVKVEFSGMIALGEIRYCNPTRRDSFQAGMRIDSTQKLV